MSRKTGHLKADKQLAISSRQQQGIVAAAIVLGILAFMLPTGFARWAVWASALTLALVAGGHYLMVTRLTSTKKDQFSTLAQLIEEDPAPGFVTELDGRVVIENAAARARYGDADSDTLAGRLASSFANPVGLLTRLQATVNKHGAGQEDIVTRAGHLRLSVHGIDAEGSAYVWRIEKIAERQQPRQSSDGNMVPMVMIGRSNAILFMNDPARELVGNRAKSLDQLFTDLPIRNGQMMDLCTKSGKCPALVSEVEAGAGRRALFLLPAAQQTGATQAPQSFQDIPVPMLRLSRDGTVQAYNQMAVALIGDGLQESVPISDLMEGLGRSISDWLEDTLSGRNHQRSEFLRLTRADREVFVQVTLSRVTEDGERRIVAVLNDATELKTLEAQFVQSQKMQAIGQLAGGVAHDFNNLLTAISGHCDLLLLRHDQGDPDYSDLVQINQNANRAAALVGQLLAFSRKQTLRPEIIDMRDTLSDLIHLLNRLVGAKVSLTLSHDPVLQPIRADKRQLEQVLMNLVVNARDAMPGGGEIKIETECVSLDAPMKRDQVMVPVGRYVIVRVSDDGQGIAPDKLHKVFEPFFTTKRTGEGTGLGLSTAYGIIKQSGGYIFVDSTVGVGTCFTLFFPALKQSEALEAPVVQKVARAASRQGDGVILLVEDEAPVRAFASRALRMRGYTVLEADSAEAALATLEDEDLAIDVFVTDVVMPGMDGPSWVREALKVRPDVRVVFVSGYAEDSFGEAQMKIPNSVFLPKPFSLSDLTETVHKQLH